MSYQEDEFACLDSCTEYPECNWVTFYRSDGLCNLLEDCTHLDDAFENNLSAPRECKDKPIPGEIILTSP